jgi:hypothetical protein
MNPESTAVSYLWRPFAKQYKQRLEDQVGVARPDGRVVEQALDVVDDDAAERGLVGVVEDLNQGILFL